MVWYTAIARVSRPGSWRLDVFIMSGVQFAMSKALAQTRGPTCTYHGVLSRVGRAQTILITSLIESPPSPPVPSFGALNFKQAFLDDHVELRESASFGDVSAMVEQWMSLEDADKNTLDADADADNMEENGMGAFSF